MVLTVAVLPLSPPSCGLPSTAALAGPAAAPAGPLSAVLELDLGTGPVKTLGYQIFNAAKALSTCCVCCA